MRVGWIADDHGYVGGAEMTQVEFKAAVPEGVEVIDCPPGQVKKGLDRYVAHNVIQYPLEDFQGLPNLTWYHHDLSPWIHPVTREWLDRNATHIFCSDFQRKRYGVDGELIPPALDLERFKPPRHIRRAKREGVCSIAQWRSPGKGPHLLEEWAKDNGPVDVYGEGRDLPYGPNIVHKGPLAPSLVPQTLWSYETFIFLPVEPEPFCRSVAEAHFAGCRVISNGLVGAAEWLSQPEKVESAAADFWAAVCR